MSKVDKNTSLLPLKLMFESGNVKRMKDIEKLYPTLVASSIPMNHSRYINKLYKPETLSMKQVMRLAEIIDIDPKIIASVIVNELLLQKRKR